jgi:hypothetical protein
MEDYNHYQIIYNKQLKERNKKFEINSFVVFDEDSCSKEIYEKYYKDKFPLNKVFVYLGEIQQAKGHCILGDLSTGTITGIHHIENFKLQEE